MTHEPPLLTAPITVRFASRTFHLKRGLLIALTFTLHVALLGGMALTDLLVVEVMKPPRAAVDIPIHFYPPGSTGGGGGGRTSPPKEKPRNAPALQPVQPKPIMFPLPPPEEMHRSAEPLPGPPGNQGPDGGLGPGPGGPGDGPGDGTGPGNGTGGPGGPEGPGFGPDGPLYPEGHPGITPPVLIAKSRVYPRYPELARKAGVQASVLLLVVIDAEGRVGSIEVMSAPDPRYGFDLAVVEAVKQWRYQPALLDGRPVAVQASITFEFSLSR